ncbi:hypothetical protein [Streptomyces sp. NBC_00996]|uniref:hypothetical protein n=1 Tax=Streptomyces sp. NBC_00996 TaxID=2903710 RepID=UPI00386C3D12|nr:hypothetical protein OG390_00750 [Streptomyces sp. NBC_00996]
MHQLVATPFVKRHFILRPGSTKAVQLPQDEFGELPGLTAQITTSASGKGLLVGSHSARATDR